MADSSRRICRWLPILASCAFGLVLFLGLTWNSSRGTPPLDASAERYNLLARGFEGGHLYLAKPVPVELERLADPYDSNANRDIRGGTEGLLDLSYYRGRFYLYFGVSPALLAFLPWHLLTGHYLPESAAVGLFSTLGFLAGAGLLVAAWRRYFATAGSWAGAACIGLLATATTVPLIAARPAFWEVPVACAYALLQAALGLAWIAAHTPRPRRRLACLVLVGTLCGLAVGSRPTLLPAALLITLVSPMDWQGRRRPAMVPGAARSQSALHPFFVAGIPLVLVGLGLAAYNQARFGNPFQLGQHYQLSSDNVHGRTAFSLRFIPDNLRLYLLSALRWGPRFPFVWKASLPPLAAGHGDVEYAVGILPNLPALLLALAAPLAWSGRPAEEARRLRRWSVLLAGLSLSPFLVLLLFYGVCNRYEVDFLPFAALLACLGILGIATAPTGRGTGRPILRGLAAALVLYTCATVTLCSVARCEFSRWNQIGNALANRHRTDEALEVGRHLIALSNGHDGHLGLGTTLLATGRIEDAIGAFQQAVRENPADPTAQNNLGLALLRSGSAGEGIPHLRAALALDPGNAETEENLGSALLATGHPDEARSHLLAAVRARPLNPFLHTSLGLAFARTGATERAVAELSEALRLQPDNAPVENILGTLLYRLNRPDEAIVHFKDALRLQPDLTIARQNLDAALGR